MKHRFSFVVMISVIAAIHFAPSGTAFSAPADKAGDLSTHPVYSGYDFGKDSHVIDCATQPLASTMGVITEMMGRDGILAAELKERGMEIRFHPFYKGSDINFFIQRGDIECATMGDTPAITIAATFDVTLAALTKQGYSSLIAREKMLLTDLKGRTVGYTAGSTAHFNLLVALQAAGMKESDIVPVTMEVNELPEALEKERIDAFAAWEPTPSTTLAKHHTYAVVQKFLNSSYLVFTKSFTSSHSVETSLLVASYLRALRWMKKDERNLITGATSYLDTVAKFQKKPSATTVEQVASLVNEEILHIAGAPYIPLNDLGENGSIHKGYEFLQSKGVIPQSATWQKVSANLDRGIMAEVLSNAKKYRLAEFDYRIGKE